MRPELTALVVHDLKNALGGLEAELLLLERQPDPRTAARQAHAHCAELRQRFVMFLTVYGIDGRMRAQSNDESPLDLLQSLADAAAPAHPDASADVPVGSPDDVVVAVAVGDRGAAPPFWYFDRRLVRMALQAALHNAQRFARRRIELSARHDGDFLVLAIDDDGPGLGAADPSSAMSTGLGTELCRAVAAAHCHAGRNGRVVLRNRDRAPGGARFELWLP